MGCTSANERGFSNLKVLSLIVKAVEQQDCSNCTLGICRTLRSVQSHITFKVCTAQRHAPRPASTPSGLHFNSLGRSLLLTHLPSVSAVSVLCLQALQPVEGQITLIVNVKTQRKLQPCCLAREEQTVRSSSCRQSGASQNPAAEHKELSSV